MSIMNDNIMLKLPDGYSIRPMMPNDVETVYHIECEGSAKPWTMGIFYDCIRVGYQCLLLLAPDSEIIGFSITRIKAGEAHIFNIVLRETHRGQGLGTGLLEVIIASAKVKGAEQVMLEVRASNVVAIHLYQKLGFVVTGHRKDYYPGDPPEDAVLYTLTI